MCVSRQVQLRVVPNIGKLQLGDLRTVGQGPRQLCCLLVSSCVCAHGEQRVSVCCMTPIALAQAFEQVASDCAVLCVAWPRADLGFGVQPRGGGRKRVAIGDGVRQFRLPVFPECHIHVTAERVGIRTARFADRRNGQPSIEQVWPPSTREISSDALGGTLSRNCGCAPIHLPGVNMVRSHAVLDAARTRGGTGAPATDVETRDAASAGEVARHPDVIQARGQVMRSCQLMRQSFAMGRSLAIFVVEMWGGGSSPDWRLETRHAF